MSKILISLPFFIYLLFCMSGYMIGWVETIMISKRSPSPRPSTATFQLNYTVESGNEIKVQVMIGVKNGRSRISFGSKIMLKSISTRPYLLSVWRTSFQYTLMSWMQDYLVIQIEDFDKVALRVYSFVGKSVGYASYRGASNKDTYVLESPYHMSLY